MPGKTEKSAKPEKTEAPRAATPGRRGKKLSPAAKRALAEAEARRAEIDRRAKQAEQERDGRGGLDPARYGDWEVKGVASDF